MKKNRTKEEELRDILKENGLEKPSEQFSEQLTHFIVQEYKTSQVVEFKASKWLGKFIIGALLSFNLLFLCYLNPFSIQPVLSISIAAFILGLWGLIGLTKKSQLSKISSI